MKRKREKCHPLEFATQMVNSVTSECFANLLECEKTFAKMSKNLLNAGYIEAPEETQRLARAAYTCSDWLKYKQCFRITKELAEDLFTMEDLSFPLEQVKMPFPTIYLDFSNIEFHTIKGCKALGVYVTIADVPYGDNIASLCNLLTISKDGSEYVYGGVSFDFFSKHMTATLSDTIENLSESFPEERILLKNALIFAAYLSSVQPDITENEEQKKIYKPSNKPKYSSLRKWDVGVRYMQQSKEYITKGTARNSHHQSPRPHIRRAHWHCYKIGPGRKETKVLWLPPVTVGTKENLPVVIRKE